MKNTTSLLAVAFLALSHVCIAQNGQSANDWKTAAAKHWTADNGNGTYSNPLFYEEFEDPDINPCG